MRTYMLALTVAALAATGCDADGRDYQVDLPDVDIGRDTVRDTVRDTATIRIPDVDIVRDSITIPIPKVRIDTNP